MLNIVLTHGRDKPFEIPDTIQGPWIDATRFGLRRAEAYYADTIPIAFAFYGDLWRPDASFGVEKDETEQDELAVEILEEMLDEAQIKVDAPESFDVGVNWEIFGPGLVALDQKFGAGQLFLRWFLGDLAQYFNNDHLREATIERVAQVVSAAGGKTVLIAHSMGTIVSYDLLTRHPDLPVRALITIGSPLGLKTIRQKVTNAAGQTPFPPKLHRWINVSNKDDVATMVRNLAPLFTADDGRTVEDVTSVPKEGSITDLAGGHDPIIYLSSMALAQKLREVVEESAAIS